MKAMSESGIRYAVRVFCKDGRSFLAHGDLTCKMFDRRKKAIAWKNELLTHLGKGSKCKVVKVRYTVEEVEEPA